MSYNELKKHYHIQCLIYHPDKNNSDDAQEKFQEVHSAYEFLLDYLKHDNLENGMGMDIEPDQDSEFSYKDILIQFLRSISENNIEPNILFYNIIHKITEKCEEKSIELLDKLNKEMLLKTYDILYKYHNIFRISEDFVLKVQKIVEERLKHDECVILNPTLEDLFEYNIYKLTFGEKILPIPLWHHELVYDINGADLYVKCIPILPDDYTIDNENNLFVDINKIDIKFILENRIKTKVVIYDGEWKEIEVIGNLEDYAKEFFDDVHLKFESPFLKHNINIWYEKLDGVNSYVCGKILNKPIYKCLWFTMISDEYRGRLSLNEVNTIIKLSNHLNFPYEPPSEWLVDEKDVYGRDKIKNKYRILEKARKKYLN